MKAGETTLRELIRGEQQFVIPLYQRTYSWGFEQLDRLWTDVVNQAGALAAGGSTTHFLGSVVLAPSPNLSPTTSQWIVVDGQQRLTTLMLALCAIRDHLAAEDPVHFARINELHLINKFKQGDLRYRLLPTQVDRPALMACVDGTHHGQVKGAIGDAYQFFRSRLSATEDPADPHDVERLESVVLDRLALVQVVVEKDDNAFRIFESLNNTGMPLSPVDLIRNYVFMCLPNRGEEVYRHHWTPLQEGLRAKHGNKALETLMYLVLVLNRGEDATYSDVYRGHQQLLDETGGDEKKVEEYVADLARRARHLELILDPKDEPDERIRGALAFLHEWQAQTAYPTIMRLLELREDGEASDDEVARALTYIESFLVRRMIASVSTKNLNRIFQRLTGRLSPDEPVDETVRSALSPARLYWPTDEQLRAAIRTGAFYWQGRAVQRKLVLRRLAETFKQNEPGWLSSKKITIEHVMPQHLTDAWRAELGADGDDPVTVHDELVHTLGNLTLTAYNSELGDMPYSDKRKRLGQTGIAMTHAIVEQPHWRRTQILSRADDLADRAVTIWPGPDEQERGEPPQRDWTPLHDALAAIPTGTWTTVAALSEVIGSAPIPVAVHLSSVPLRNAHRVLSAEGTPPPEFRHLDDRDARELLTEEGVVFDDDGRADKARRLTARELAQELKLPGAEDMQDAEPADIDLSKLSEHEHRFHRQVGDRSGPDVARAVSELIDLWRAKFNTFWFGTSTTARCSPYLRHGGTDYWMLNIYPDSVEIPFTALRRRPPFDDPALRDELRQRLNEAPGVEIPESKLGLYPNFPIAVLTDPAAWDVVVATLEWFVAQVHKHSAP
ncbi:DUF262 domain-containing HNH endonuclease family protein [Actinomadura sp. NPDC047616]|uniref:DUF262 domain-containing protein n=1 Tax=Actinomadura sp. NPDC047616 TaxID=3155914 RepID=UPI0033C9F6F4